MEFTDKEKFRLKQLVCDHERLEKHGHGCTCCGQYDQYCLQCSKNFDHQCNDHDTDDGYCNSCR